MVNFTVFRGIREVPFRMALPLMFLCLGSIFSGYLFKDVLSDPVFLKGIFFREGSFLKTVTAPDLEYIPIFARLIPTMFSLLGLLVGFLVCRKKTELVSFHQKINTSLFFRVHRRIYGFLSNKWYFDALYNHYFSLPFLRLSCWYFTYIDQNFLKFFGPVGMTRAVFLFSSFLVRRNQSGLINHYAFFMVYALLFFLFTLWLG